MTTVQKTSNCNDDPTPQLVGIAQQFVPQGQVSAVSPLGNGNINRTYLVTVAGDICPQELPPHPTPSQPNCFVLQRINAQVFRQPEQVIQNMVILSEHLRGLELLADIPHRWETPAILATREGQNFWVDEAGHYWRAISFIANSQVLESVSSPAHAREIGYGLGLFHRLISTLPAEELADTLEGFHITPSYLAQYQQVLKGRIAQAELVSPGSSHQAALLAAIPEAAQRQQVRYCLEFIAARQDGIDVLEQAKARGELQLRPIHGDPKVNNVLLGPEGKAVGLIDLDTLKPGLVHYDIGDCLRSGCNRLGEETPHWQQVSFDLDLAEAMLAGYLSTARAFLTDWDYYYLYEAIRLIAFELGLRFFTDYLAGDVYFKVARPGHNLARALVQFKLTESIEAQADALKAMIERLRH